MHYYFISRTGVVYEGDESRGLFRRAADQNGVSMALKDYTYWLLSTRRITPLYYYLKFGEES